MIPAAHPPFSTSPSCCRMQLSGPLRPSVCAEAGGISGRMGCHKTENQDVIRSWFSIHHRCLPLRQTFCCWDGDVMAFLCVPESSLLGAFNRWVASSTILVCTIFQEHFKYCVSLNSKSGVSTKNEGLSLHSKHLHHENARLWSDSYRSKSMERWHLNCLETQVQSTSGLAAVERLRDKWGSVNMYKRRIALPHRTTARNSKRNRPIRGGILSFNGHFYPVWEMRCLGSPRFRLKPKNSMVLLRFGVRQMKHRNRRNQSLRPFWLS